MFPQPPRCVQRPGTSPSRAPASRSAALCGAPVLRVPVSVLCARCARCCVSVTSLPLAARLLIHSSLPRLRSLTSEHAVWLRPCFSRPAGLPRLQSPDFCAPPAWLNPPTIRMYISLLTESVLSRARRCTHPLLPVCLISLLELRFHHGSA